MKVYVNEILLSFVTRITEREKKKVLKDVRKEIAVLSIQSIHFDKFLSTDENMETHKLLIQSI